MRMSNFFAPTLKEIPREAELPSHVLMFRAGYIRQVAAGVYDFLPLGVRVLRKVEQIVREEMNRAGALEVYLPMVCPAELWKKSGRWNYYGPELLRFRDRHDREFCLGPTHEEVITDLVARDVRSYRQLPINLYQIQVKFRDELKPRAGLMRAREFIMKDAYSFDVDKNGAKHSYRLMYEAYWRICKRCGFDFRVVEADTGNIGGSLSHEFQVVANTGEDYVLTCRECGFTVNKELAPLLPPQASQPPPRLEQPIKVYTPQKCTIEEVASFLKVEPQRVVKTLIYLADNKPIAVMIRGDHELSEVKLRRSLDVESLEMADNRIVETVTKAPVGFAGPLGLTIPIYADYAVGTLANFIVGGNEQDYHIKGVNIGRDFEVQKLLDIRQASEGEICPHCNKGTYYLFRGIEVGHIFYLGTKYSQPMGCTFLDDKGQEIPCEMGCYGIGITRIMCAAIEQHHDDKGICWPITLAPFQIEIIPLAVKEQAIISVADRLYREFESKGLEILLDDRDERPGVKFNDADLIGIPFHLIVGARGLSKGVVELKIRASNERVELPIDSAVNEVMRAVKEAYKSCTPPQKIQIPV